MDKITRSWKVYGIYDGEHQHRQKESFNPSRKYDFSSDENGIEIIEILNSDKTGTNNYSIVKITTDSFDRCYTCLIGQITDGIFENSRTGAIIEIP